WLHERQGQLPGPARARRGEQCEGRRHDPRVRRRQPRLLDAGWPRRHPGDPSRVHAQRVEVAMPDPAEDLAKTTPTSGGTKAEETPSIGPTARMPALGLECPSCKQLNHATVERCVFCGADLPESMQLSPAHGQSGWVEGPEAPVEPPPASRRTSALPSFTE